MREFIEARKNIYGAWVITILIDEVQFEHLQYYGYSKKEAIKRAIESESEKIFYNQN